ncbi:MAG: glutamate--tRNA ligase [Kiritimatiellae bacterium]|nr:glutamate--tRNA ligase [Kiritimatiellia bacterium]
MSVRVRFAPSPTGEVHIGNIRTAIYNWLFARHERGKFLLRIEDTDRERSTPEAVRAVLDAMNWLGLDYDEEPLYQSTRLAAHVQAAERLLQTGHAYKEDKGGTGQGECVVFRMPGTDVAYHDEVKGDLRKEAKDMKDFVIVRSDGTPVFHLANVVDDIEMGITHILRGDDHVENTYRHIALYRALEAAVPHYAHLPMIVNAQGKPYSKRDGAAFVGDFKEQGYLPDVLFNFLSLLGWSPGGDREVLTREEMVALFDLARINSAPARMDMEKLLWMNGEYIRAQSPETFARHCRAVLEQRGLWGAMCGSLADYGPGIEPEVYFRRVLALMQVRVKRYPDLADQAPYFFTEDYPCDAKAMRKRLGKPGVPEAVRLLRERYAGADPLTAAEAEQALRETADAAGLGAGALIHAVRVAVSGSSQGPGLFEMLDVLGGKRVAARMARTLSQLEKEGT